MAKIPLRVYNREIETLIERGQIEEAIAHSKYILRFFPKHIDTYRLLGKAYIESQRYSEAADILQRILSVVPDDFVSQIGMGIIREDEGNLDAAIYHMERAFEIQPSNAAVQDELRRLYGRRDGVEPPKLRLTRGALVRMYARGNLYRQTIAEIRAALAESQDRFDLEVVLARMYYLLGQIVEATDAASRLVIKLPFCMEANKILAETLPAASKIQEAEIYRQRVFALDPYAAYVSPNAPTSSLVPDNAVTLDRLDWDPANDTQQPGWARTLGKTLPEPAETIPDWLSGVTAAVAELPSASSSSAPVSEPPADIFVQPADNQPVAPFSEPQTEDAAIPDWLKDAGWQGSTGPEQESHVVEEPAPVDEEAPVKSELPDWLKKLEPTNQPETPPQPEPRLQTGELEIPEWLSKIEATESTFKTAETRAEEAARPEDVPLPAEAAVQNEDESLPDWLKDLQKASQPMDTIAESDASVPDWLKSIPAAEQPPAIAQTPEYLIQPEQPGDQAAFFTPEAESAEVPDWLLGFSQQASESAEAQSAELDSPAIPDWMQGIVAEGTASSPETTVAAVEQLPVDGTAELPQVSQSVPAEPPAASPVPDAALFEAEDPEMAAALAWMESLAARQGADQETLSLPANQGEIERPEWVTQELVDQSATEPAETQPEPPEHFEAASETAPAAEPTLPSPVEAVASMPADAEPASEFGTDDFDATFAWLESLAANQGATEGTLSTSPEQRTGETPAWIAEQALDKTELEVVAPPEPISPTGTVEPDLILPPAAIPAEAVKEQAGETGITQPVKINPVAEEPVSPVLLEQESAAPAPEATPDSKPDWLSSLLKQKDEMFTRPLSEDDLLVASQPAVDSLIAPAPQDLAEVEPVQDLPDLSPQQLAGAEIAPEPPAVEISAAEIEQAPAPEVPPPFVAAEKPEPPAIPAEPIFNRSERSIATPKELETVQLPVGKNENEAYLVPAPMEEESIPELPSWLFEAEPAQKETAAPEQSPSFETLPAWLQDLESVPDSQPARPNDEALSVTVWLSQTNLEAIQDKSTEGHLQVPEGASTPPGEPTPPVEKVPLAQPPAAAAPQSVPVEPPKAALRPGPDPEKSTALLAQAKNAIASGNVDQAAGLYNQLISEGGLIPETINSLQEALYRFPVDIFLWQLLGDAYYRNNQVKEALNSYTKAEELLK